MHKVFLAGFVAALVLAPVGAHAEDDLSVAAGLSSEQSAASLGWNMDRLTDLGTGAVIGGIAAYYGLGFTGATIAGAVVGGAIGDWWYEREEALFLNDFVPLERKESP